MAATDRITMMMREFDRFKVIQSVVDGYRMPWRAAELPGCQSASGRATDYHVLRIHGTHHSYRSKPVSFFKMRVIKKCRSFLLSPPGYNLSRSICFMEVVAEIQLTPRSGIISRRGR